MRFLEEGIIPKKERISLLCLLSSRENSFIRAGITRER